VLVQISNDDVIGCATLPFTDLTEGHFDGWKEIIVPITTAKKSKFTTVSDLKIPELKLLVTTSVSRNKIDFFPLAPTLEVEVPLAQVDTSVRIEAQLHAHVDVVIKDDFLDDSEIKAP
jgi:hypothetical protein